MKTCDLSQLEVFALVAQQRSFRKAAQLRGVSASALSHTLRTLEEQLGVRLLNRTTRSVTLTEAGQRLLTRITPALQEIDEAIEEINDFRTSPTGTLRLNVPRTVADLILPPFIKRFLATYPDARLEIVTDDGFVDIVKAGFDAGVRLGESLALDMIAVPLSPAMRMTVVAAPSYLSTHTTPTIPQDLLQHPCIGRRFTNGEHYAWEFEKAGQKLNVAVNGPLILDDNTTMLRAALDGIGFAFVFENLVTEQLAQGTLIEVLSDWSPTFPGFFLYHPSRRQMPAVLRSFIDMLNAARPNDHL
ncbi:MAG: LysR family transcriptional regulator [Glaciimonas sp.]|nr:LysR family transcriptional regulator [Glaciimonas sp.]